MQLQGLLRGGRDGSAECISEAPSGIGYPAYTPVADYSKTTFYACADTIGSNFAGIREPPGWLREHVQAHPDGLGLRLVDQKPASLTSYYYGANFGITWLRYR